MVKKTNNILVVLKEELAELVQESSVLREKLHKEKAELEKKQVAFREFNEVTVNRLRELRKKVEEYEKAVTAVETIEK